MIIRQYLILVLLGIVFALCFAQQASAYSNGYSYRRSITIDHTKCGSSDSTNFPVLVSGTYAYLATTANGGNVTNSSGYDIIFTSDINGNTKLNWEIETYTASSGAVNIWVQVPTVSHITDTVIYMFYGDSNISTVQSTASSTWDSNYKMVNHLATVPGSDSTINANAMTNNSATATTGQVDGGANFASQSITAASSASLNVSGNITIEGWMYPTVNKYNALICHGPNNGNRDYNFYTMNGNTSAVYIALGGNNNPGQLAISSPWVLNSWNHFVMTADGVHVKVYLNGSSVASATDAHQPTGNAQTTYLANDPETDSLAGKLDEVRVSNTIRSADWILSEYNNQNSPSTFYTVGSAITVDGSAYAYKRKITIDHTKCGSSDSTNFPVLVSGTYNGSGGTPDLRTVANGGKVQNSNGYDIIFTSDVAGTTKLNWEIETYTASTGVVNFWVQVPTVSHTTDTTIYMFYGNAAISTFQSTASAVWDSYYKIVDHLADGTTLSATDSTGNTATGTITTATATAGKVDGAGSFGSLAGDKIQTGLTSGLSTTITIEGWVNPTTGISATSRWFDQYNSGTIGSGLSWQGTGTIFVPFSTTGGNFTTTALTQNVLTHVVITYDASNVANKPTVYENKVSQTVNVGTAPVGTVTTLTGNWYLGNRQDGIRVWIGALDEFRVSLGILRSADWVTTEYNNQNSPSTFYTLGNENLTKDTLNFAGD